MFGPSAWDFSAPLVALPGAGTFKRCACGALFNLAIPGPKCNECGGTGLDGYRAWLDVTEKYHALYPRYLSFRELSGYGRLTGPVCSAWPLPPAIDGLGGVAPEHARCATVAG